MGFRTERWSIKPLSCPRPFRYCPDCGLAREFVCSERFRVNAQKKIIDVWLKYRCIECGNVWKLPAIERCAITKLNAASLDAYLRHDPEMVWTHAFDLPRLRSHCAEVHGDVDVAVERWPVADNGLDDGACEDASGGLIIHFEMSIACDVRLDRLLARELNVSRADVRQWSDSGRLVVLSAGGGVNRPVRSGLVVRVDSVNRASASTTDAGRSR